MKIVTKSIVATFVTAFGFAGIGWANTLNWGNTVNFDGDSGFQEMSFDSDGIAIDSTGSTFTFEIGTFTKLAAGFQPSNTNVDVWKDNWNPLQATSYSSSLNWFSDTYFLGDGDAGHVGERAYIWVYDSDIASSTSDWFLVTGDTEGGAGPQATDDNNWRVPSTNGLGSFDWRLSTANTAVWGSLNSGAAVGFGMQNVDPGAHEMQAFAVPEPTSAALMLAGVVLGLRRRRG